MLTFNLKRVIFFKEAEITLNHMEILLKIKTEQI